MVAREKREPARGLDFPHTWAPRETSGAVSIVAANRCYYMKNLGPGRTISKIGFEVGVASGNMSVAIFRGTGLGRLWVPKGNLIAASGAFVTPAAGYREASLGGSFYLGPDDVFALTCDNTTATFRSGGAAALDSNLGLGDQYYQASAHPAPASVGTLVAAVGRSFCLVGVQ